MSKTKNNNLGTDFTDGNIPSLILAFMLPFLLANLLNDLYNMVDMVIIGKFTGSVGLAAVTLGGKLLSICTNVSVALASGGQVLISQQVGAKKESSEISKTIGTMFSFLGVISIVTGGILFVYSESILNSMNTPMEAFPSALGYFRITCVGLPLVFGYNAVSAVMRGMGDSKRPLLFIAVASLTNLILDLVFIVGFHMGATGAALATVTGQGVAFAFSFVYLYQRKENFVFDFSLGSMRIDRDKLKTMTKIGVPMACQSLLVHCTQLIVISQVNTLGLISSAVYGIMEKIVNISIIINQSIRSAGGGMIAQNIGAGKTDRVKKTLAVSLEITLFFSLVIGSFGILFHDAVFHLFTNDPEIMAYSRISMIISLIAITLSAIMGSYGMITTGTGNSKLAFLAGILDGVVFRLFFSWLFGNYFGYGVIGFYFGNAIARIGPIAVHTIYYYSGAWLKAKRLA